MTVDDQQALGWEIEITGGLKASFFQPDGSSRPGTDWSLVFRQPPNEHNVLIRSYANGKIDQDAETTAVLAHARSLLEGGWDPRSYGGTPGELCVEVATDQTRDQSVTKPRWKFW
jgi:hypothetical protein